MIAVSIISHGHGAMVTKLVQQLLDCPEVGQIIVTLNIPESLSLPENSRVECIRNCKPQGFGTNHNAAFNCCTCDYFCPLNPDIVLRDNPFPVLLRTINTFPAAALVAPRVVSSGGAIEDSVRAFPTVASLIRKFLFGDKGLITVSGHAPLQVDWVAGMFMLFPAQTYRQLNGFDPGYFLYYEDVDICCRAWLKSMPVILDPAATVVHDAQRESHRKLRHMRWHLQSMGRYLWRYKNRNPRPGCADK